VEGIVKKDANKAKEVVACNDRGMNIENVGGTSVRFFPFVHEGGVMNVLHAVRIPSNRGYHSDVFPTEPLLGHSAAKRHERVSSYLIVLVLSIASHRWSRRWYRQRTTLSSQSNIKASNTLRQLEATKESSTAIDCGRNPIEVAASLI